MTVQKGEHAQGSTTLIGADDYCLLVAIAMNDRRGVPRSPSDSPTKVQTDDG